MGVLLTLGCYLVTLAPAVSLFIRIIAPDPLKIILFVLGAFMWLLSLLFTSIIWYAVSPLQDYILISVGCGIIYQEALRVVCFFLLKRAQKGLGALANPSSAQHVHVNGVTSLANSRHLLAVVCGLGMGVTAALFLTMNAFAAVSGSGVIGRLPLLLGRDHGPERWTPRLIPLYWALNGMLLSMLHVVWTVLMWDCCHRFSSRSSTNELSPLLSQTQSRTAFLIPGAVAVLSHFLSCASSAMGGVHPVAVAAKALLLFSLLLYSYTLIRHESPLPFLKELARAVGDWVTLAYLRKCIRECRQAADDSQPHQAHRDLASSPLAAGDNEEDGVAVRDPSGSTARQRRTVRT